MHGCDLDILYPYDQLCSGGQYEEAKNEPRPVRARSTLRCVCCLDSPRRLGPRGSHPCRQEHAPILDPSAHVPWEQREPKA